MTDIETPVLDTLVQMSENTLPRSRLDAETFMLLRIAALVSVGAPPASYTANFGAAEEFGVEPEKVQGALVAIAPVVGTARIAQAAVAIATALNVEIPLGPDGAIAASHSGRGWDAGPDQRTLIRDCPEARSGRPANEQEAAPPTRRS